MLVVVLTIDRLCDRYVGKAAPQLGNIQTSELRHPFYARTNIMYPIRRFGYFSLRDFSGLEF